MRKERPASEIVAAHGGTLMRPKDQLCGERDRDPHERANMSRTIHSRAKVRAAWQCAFSRGSVRRPSANGSSDRSGGWNRRRNRGVVPRIGGNRQFIDDEFLPRENFKRGREYRPRKRVPERTFTATLLSQRADHILWITVRRACGDVSFHLGLCMTTSGTLCASMVIVVRGCG